jgi:hypothetical protein
MRRTPRTRARLAEISAFLVGEELAHRLPNWLLHVRSRTPYAFSTNCTDGKRVWLPPFIQQALSLMQGALGEARSGRGPRRN